MKQPEGLRVSLVEEGMLDGSGVLKSANGTTAAYGLPEDSIQLFLAIAVAGEGGIAQNKLPKELKANLKEALLPLELQNLVEWQRDARGQQTYLVLTWRGKEALDAARMRPTSQGSWADRRRTSVSPEGDQARASTEARSSPAKPAPPTDADVFHAEQPLHITRASARRRSISAGGSCAVFDAAISAQVDDVPLDFESALFS